jgi:hypothetical protein
MGSLTTVAERTGLPSPGFPQFAAQNMALGLRDDLVIDDFSEQEGCGDGDDRHELKPTSHALGITKNYVHTWSRQDAFRELYQNW